MVFLETNIRRLYGARLTRLRRSLSATKLIAILLFQGFVTDLLAQESQAKNPGDKIVLAHYMPWYEAKPFSNNWGWHWTMNTFDPEKQVLDRPEIASHFMPLIGPYDSGDPCVLEYHLLLMKLAGSDGVIVDWYGLQKFRDYELLHRNTERLVEHTKRLGMKFIICYEDQTIPALVEAGRLKGANRVSHATEEIQWLKQNWFGLESYVKLDGQPVLLSFGQTGLTDAEWSQCLIDLKMPLAYFSLHHRRTAALGAFDWPIPAEGTGAIKRFEAQSRGWAKSIPVVFSRFKDIYAEAKIHASYGQIDDRDGMTFKHTLELAMNCNAPIIQIATWNDWGEGTSIEPSQEFGYRDLEVILGVRRKRGQPKLDATASALRLPLKLLELRRAYPNLEQQKKLDAITELLAKGKLSQATFELQKWK